MNNPRFLLVPAMAAVLVSQACSSSTTTKVEVVAATGGTAGSAGTAAGGTKIVGGTSGTNALGGATQSTSSGSGGTANVGGTGGATSVVTSTTMGGSTVTVNSTVTGGTAGAVTSTNVGGSTVAVTSTGVGGSTVAVTSTGVGGSTVAVTSTGAGGSTVAVTSAGGVTAAGGATPSTGGVATVGGTGTVGSGGATVSTGGIGTGGSAPDCAESSTRLCNQAGIQGSCASGTQTCTNGAWGACSIAPKPADGCVQGNDDNCNGTPNEGCACLAEQTRACANAKGNCAAGTQTCSNSGVWSNCSILAAAQDTCVAGDDANCNGTPNEGCSCTNGSTQACGNTPSTGICHQGQAVCTNGAWGACTGAVFPATRNCSSTADNDCDGLPDNTVDTVCQCIPGNSQNCQTHPTYDGKGICTAGTQSCVAASNNASSNWGLCNGSVGPGARNCNSTLDNDCDGSPDNTIDSVCKCSSGGSQSCGTHPGYDGKGICTAGTQYCVVASNNASSDWGTCGGSVGPAARNCASTLDNNCDGSPDNTVDTTCKCPIGGNRQCGTHPQDGTGPCKAGTQACVASSGNATSDWGTCTGSVGPTTEVCDGKADEDCSGRIDNGCPCPTNLPGPQMKLLPEDYCIDTTEVTRDQYQTWLNTGPSFPTDSTCSYVTSYTPYSDWPPNAGGVNRGNHPVLGVDWCQAREYCKAAGKHLCGAIGGGSLSLDDYNNATKGQWYNACSAHGANQYTYGNTFSQTACNIAKNATPAPTWAGGSVATCQSPVSAYAGVYDMNGNALEWEDSCGDATPTANCRVHGGSWGSALPNGTQNFVDCTLNAYLDGYFGRKTADMYLGFRCCYR
jgi:formylglycine-generating enzyme